MINKRKKTGWIKWLLMGVVVVALAVLAWPTVSGLLSGASTDGAPVSPQTAANLPGEAAQTGLPASSSQGTATVTRGALAVSVSGSGKVSPADSRGVYSQTSGLVDEVGVKVGDSVQAGDTLMTLASDDLSASIASLERTLFDAQIALGDVRDTGSSYNIYAPSAGRIKMLKVEEEDDVATVMRQYGYLCVISRDGKMKVEFEPESGGAALNVGDAVRVWIDSVAVEGRVEQLTGLSGNISVTIDDDEYDVGEAAQITTLLNEKLGEGVLEVNMPIPVTGIGGAVDTIYYEDNEEVGSGYRLFYLTGRTPSSELQAALLAYEEARIALENAKEQREGLIVRAPMDGVVTAVDVSLGAKVEEGALAFSLQSNDAYTVVVSVDELDIVDVRPGQAATVELDAHPNKTFPAVVERISGVGTVEGGVATYEVTLQLDGTDGFMDGMTASAEVQTVSKADVLLLPVEAISTSGGQNYVTLATGQQNPVETGVSDGTNIEILSGVSEGDSVQITRQGNSGSTGTFSLSGGGARAGMMLGGGGAVMRGF